MLLKAPESALNITPKSHGEYFLRKTNKFTGEVTEYRQTNLITDAWGALLLSQGGIPAHLTSLAYNVPANAHTNLRVLWLCTDTEEPYPDLASDVDVVPNKRHGLDYFLGTSRSDNTAFHFGRDLAEYTLEAINKNSWSSVIPFGIVATSNANSGAGALLGGMRDTTAGSDRLKTYAHEGDGYLHAKAKATFFGETGYASSDTHINSVRVGFRTSSSTSSIYDGHNILSWAKLDTPIPVTAGDVISVEWEATACYAGAPHVTTGVDVRATTSVSSASMQLQEGQYDYGVDPSGPPSSTVSVNAAVTVRSALTATVGALISTIYGHYSRDLNTLFTRYESVRNQYLTTQVAGNSPTSTLQVGRGYLLTFNDPDLPAWVAAGYATPANNRELVVHTVTGITSPMVPGTGAATTISTLGTIAKGAEITFATPVALNPGSRKRYVVEAALRISWPVTRTPLDTAALPTEVKTALGIA